MADVKIDESLRQDVTLDDLDGDTRDIADIIGVPALLKLLEHFGGTRVYMRKLDEVLLPVVYRRVRADYYENGKSIDAIRIETGYTETWVRAILFSNGDPRQGVFFDSLPPK